jgi:hypothetical protein
MKNLENFGVQEMDAREIKNVDGGRMPSLLDSALYTSMTTVHAAVDFISGAWDRFNMFR